MLGSDSNPNPNSNPNSNIICCDSSCPPCRPVVHQEQTHCCLRFQVIVPEGRTPFTEWPWLEFEEFAMSMSILVEDRILTIQSATCLNDHQPCHECQKLKMKFPIACTQD